jgi:hypothetical protein
MTDELNGSESPVGDVIQGLLGRLSEGFVIAVMNGKLSIAHKFASNDSGVLNSFLVGFLQELLKRVRLVDAE